MEERRKFLDFEGNNVNMTIINDEKRLTLRKKHFNNRIMELMEKNYKQIKIDDSVFKRIQELNLPDEIKYKNFSDDDKSDKDFFDFVKFLISSEIVDYIKFGLYLITINLDPDRYSYMQLINFDVNLVSNIFSLLNRYPDNEIIVCESIKSLYKICTMTKSMNSENIAKIFTDKNNLESLYYASIKQKIIFNNEVNFSFIFLINSLVDSPCKKLIVKSFNNHKIFELIFNVLDFDKIHEEILIYLFLLSYSILNTDLNALEHKIINSLFKNIMIFYKSDEFNIKNACYWVFSKLTEVEYDDLQKLFLKCELVHDIINNTELEKIFIVPSIRIIGNLAVNADEFSLYLLDIGVLNFFKRMLSMKNEEILKELLWALSNFSASNKNVNIKFVEDKEMLTIIRGLFNNKSTMVLEELLYCLGNFFYNADYEIANQLFNAKLDDDIMLLFKDTKIPHLICLIVEILKNILNIPFFVKNDEFQEQHLNVDENINTNINSYLKYKKVHNPLIDVLIQKGLTDILENLLNHQNEDVANNVNSLLLLIKGDVIKI